MKGGTGLGEGSPRPPNSNSGHQAPGNPSPAPRMMAPEAVTGPGGAHGRWTARPCPPAWGVCPERGRHGTGKPEVFPESRGQTKGPSLSSFSGALTPTLTRRGRAVLSCRGSARRDPVPPRMEA